MQYSLHLHSMRLLLTCLLLILSSILRAQELTVVKGKIIDLKTNEVITGAMMVFAGTEDRCVSSFEGTFTAKTRSNSDTLIVSYVGYETQKIKVSQGITQVVQIKMNAKETTLIGVKTVNKVNRAIKLIEKAQGNKILYNIEKLNSFECESFTKIQIAVNNVSEELKNKRLLKSVEGLFDTLSYLSEDKNKLVLPIFLSENLSNFYFNKNPKQIKEVIVASRVKGVGVEDG